MRSVIIVVPTHFCVTCMYPDVDFKAWCVNYGLSDCFSDRSLLFELLLRKVWRIVCDSPILMINHPLADLYSFAKLFRQTLEKNKFAKHSPRQIATVSYLIRIMDENCTHEFNA